MNSQEKRKRDAELNEKRRQRIRDRRRRELEDAVASESDKRQRDLFEGRLLVHADGHSIEFETAPKCWHCGSTAQQRPYVSDATCPKCGREEAYVKHEDNPPEPVVEPPEPPAKPDHRPWYLRFFRKTEEAWGMIVLPMEKPVAIEDFIIEAKLHARKLGVPVLRGILSVEFFERLLMSDLVSSEQRLRLRVMDRPELRLFGIDFSVDEDQDDRLCLVVEEKIRRP